jgi:predicted Ser/Thr protein kinase
LVLPCRFGRYEVRQLLGKGGMGAVYLAHDPQLDRLVALKIPSFSAGESDELAARFLREARAAATLNHPGICPVYDVGQIDGVMYLTMAFIEGQPLSSLVAGGQPLPPEMAVRLMRELALALQEAHEHGIVHRDLKPANVMLNRKRQPVIMDFGLARRGAADETRLTRSGVVMGTPAYMSPEQVNGEVDRMGPPTDVYALGVILYELLTGKLPFDGAPGTLMVHILQSPVPPLSTHVGGLDHRLQEVIGKALAKRPEDRYANADALARALGAILETPGPAAAPEIVALPAEPVVAEVVGEKPRRRNRAARPPERRQAPAPKSRAGSTPLLLGCGGCLLAVVAATGGLVYLGSVGFRSLSDFISREMDRAREFDAATRLWAPPPADAGPAVLFPKQVGAYSLVGHDTMAAQPFFDIKVEGKHATYRGAGGTVQMYVYRANDLESFALMTRAYEKVRIQEKDGRSGNDGLREVRGDPNSPPLIYSHESFGEKGRYGIFWWKHGWLLHASADSRTTSPDAFLTRYLLAQTVLVKEREPAK